MSPRQMIDLAYVIFAKQPILQQDLRLWNRKPIAKRTWANMMTHLRNAQTDLSSLPSALETSTISNHHIKPIMPLWPSLLPNVSQMTQAFSRLPITISIPLKALHHQLLKTLPPMLPTASNVEKLTSRLVNLP